MSFGNYDHTFKLIAIGNPSVGKSTLMTKYTNNTYKDNSTTIGVDFAVSYFDLDGSKFRLQIWDTAGLDKFFSITKIYFRGINAAIVCFSIIDYASFTAVNKWLTSIKENCNTDPVIVLVGTKADYADKRTVPVSDIDNLIKELNIDYIEVSSKDDSSTVLGDKLFKHVTRLIVDKQGIITKEDTNIRLIDDRKIVNWCCLL